MHPVLTNQITDKKPFVSGNYCGKSTESLGALFNFFLCTYYEVRKISKS